MTKYKVGDKVVVRPDLQEDCYYYMSDGKVYDFAVEEMCVLVGGTVTISEIIDGAYRIEEDRYTWTDEMFLGIVNSEQDDFDGQTLVDFLK